MDQGRSQGLQGQDQGHQELQAAIEMLQQDRAIQMTLIAYMKEDLASKQRENIQLKAQLEALSEESAD